MLHCCSVYYYFCSHRHLSDSVTASFPQQLSGWCITSKLFPRVYAAQSPPFALNLLSLKMLSDVKLFGQSSQFSINLFLSILLPPPLTVSAKTQGVILSAFQSVCHLQGDAGVTQRSNQSNTSYTPFNFI